MSLTTTAPFCICGMEKLWYTIPMEQRRNIKTQLTLAGHTPNPALGQNFLTDEGTIAKILETAEIEGQLVVEIGPGLGALTRPLSTLAAKVVAVEKDARLAEGLRTQLSSDHVTVITGDFLDADLPALTEGKPWVALGNLPYYVTTPIVEKLLVNGPESMTLMMQSEAAQRFFALPGDRVYGPVAVMSQYFYQPQPVCAVPPSSFYPIPKVDSAVVRLTRVERALDAPGFLTFLKRAFAMRRKTLRNNLAPKSGFDEALEALGLPAGVRAEAIPPESLAALYQLEREGGLQPK